MLNTLTENEVYTVTTTRGALFVRRRADGKIATFTGRGLAAMFRKHLCEYDSDVERVVSAWVRAEGKSVVWQ